MRKDVKLGFGIGGVLLAVIIVAVLVIHRNQNKPVANLALSGPNAQGSGDQGGIDVTTQQPDQQKPADPSIDASKSAAAKPQDQPSQDQWDLLFASNTDPVKARLDNPKRKQTPVDPSAQKNTDDAASPQQPKPMDPPSDSHQESTGPHSPTVRTHTVQSGETLSGIAKTVYGDSRQYKLLLTANPGVDAARLRPGIVLQIPLLQKTSSTSAPREAQTPTAPEKPSADGKTYTVLKGDSLYAISRKLYGSGEHQEELYALNKQTIGADSTRLKPGMVLKLPEKAK